MEADSELLERLRNGDEHAFVMLVEQYHAPMLRLATSMINSQALAEEAVQDTWMGVVRGIEQFEGRSSLKTWLFRILVNRVRTTRGIEEKRRLDRAPSVDPRRFDRSGQWAQPLQHWEDDVDERVDASAYVPTLRSALEQLPARQRSVVFLRDVEGLTGEETCDVLGLKPGNQRILLHRGRAALRNRLASEVERP
ncbi:MAG TPA: RNA polymerase sigma factor [Candidatus Cybelea sp.]|jgi:RNA polymerase sigma-70 factor (ECF subfamily)